MRTQSQSIERPHDPGRTAQRADPDAHRIPLRHAADPGSGHSTSVSRRSRPAGPASPPAREPGRGRASGELGRSTHSGGGARQRDPRSPSGRVERLVHGEDTPTRSEGIPCFPGNSCHRPAGGEGRPMRAPDGWPADRDLMDGLSASFRLLETGRRRSASLAPRASGQSGRYRDFSTRIPGSCPGIWWRASRLGNPSSVIPPETEEVAAPPGQDPIPATGRSPLLVRTQRGRARPHLDSEGSRSDRTPKGDRSFRTDARDSSPRLRETAENLAAKSWTLRGTEGRGAYRAPVLLTMLIRSVV